MYFFLPLYRFNVRQCAELYVLNSPVSMYKTETLQLSKSFDFIFLFNSIQFNGNITDIDYEWFTVEYSIRLKH